MASSQPPALTAGDRTLLFLLLLLVTARFSSAQSPPSSSSGNSNNSPYLSNPNFNPSMAIVIVVLISAFFFLGFFSIYIRQCAGDRRGSEASNARNRGANARSRRQRGLDPAILATFPTLLYSDVRDHKLGKGSLECAVCLSEFDDDESLRLLPRCDHVFHPDCIDAWLAAHVTCPVCRCNLEETPADPQPEIGQIDQNPTQEPEPARPEPEPQQVAIQVGPAEEDEERKAEIENLEKFVNTKRARSRARPARFPRSHSTGHSLVMPGENLDRFTLRLPTNIRKEIVERAEMMQRAKSLGVYPAEGSSRRGGGGGRSIHLGRSDRWGSFLMRTLSMKMTNWGRRGDGDGSSSIRGGFFRRGDSIKGEGSTKGGGVKFNAFDCYGGAATKSEESQSSAFNRV